MHSSAKSPGLPGESRDERLTHIQRGVHGLELLPTHTHTKMLSTQRHKQVCSHTHSCVHLVPPSPVCLIVLSVRMVF